MVETDISTCIIKRRCTNINWLVSKKVVADGVNSNREMSSACYA